MVDQQQTSKRAFFPPSSCPRTHTCTQPGACACCLAEWSELPQFRHFLAGVVSSPPCARPGSPSHSGRLSPKVNTKSLSSLSRECVRGYSCLAPVSKNNHSRPLRRHSPHANTTTAEANLGLLTLYNIYLVAAHHHRESPSTLPGACVAWLLHPLLCLRRLRTSTQALRWAKSHSLRPLVFLCAPLLPIPIRNPDAYRHRPVSRPASPSWRRPKRWSDGY